MLGAASVDRSSLGRIRETKELTRQTLWRRYAIASFCTAGELRRNGWPHTSRPLARSSIFCEGFYGARRLGAWQEPSVVNRDKDEPAMFTAEFFDANGSHYTRGCTCLCVGAR